MKRQAKETKIAAWAALIRAQQTLLERVERDLKGAQMPPLSWYDVLLELDRAADGKLRLQDIGARILLTKSNVTRLLDRLEGEGLIIREDCHTDRRGAFAVITEKGRDLRRKMWPLYEAAIGAHFAAKISEEEAVLLLALMRKLYS
jgi:DNA-binding MarR family transcriptional regulator